MSMELEFTTRAVSIGIGATVVMDLWAILQRRLWAVPGLDYAMVGRWLGHIPRGRFIHDKIGGAEPIAGEKPIGWAAHYAIGVIFAAMLIGICGLEWARQPTLTPALIAGLVSLIAPFFLLQPGMGAGIAASKTPQPNVARLRSVIAHLSFGIGLYLAAELAAVLFPVFRELP